MRVLVTMLIEAKSVQEKQDKLDILEDCRTYFQGKYQDLSLACNNTQLNIEIYHVEELK